MYQCIVKDSHVCDACLTSLILEGLIEIQVTLERARGLVLQMRVMLHVKKLYSYQMLGIPLVSIAIVVANLWRQSQEHECVWLSEVNYNLPNDGMSQLDACVNEPISHASYRGSISEFQLQVHFVGAQMTKTENQGTSELPKRPTVVHYFLYA